MAQLVHTLPGGESVRGVTLLAGEIYLLRQKARDQVEVYDVITYNLMRRLTVPNARIFSDMTSCEHYRCVYIGGSGDDCIHRLDASKGAAFTRWTVNGEPRGLSVNAEHNVIVTCGRVRKIKEFSSHCDLLRELTLPDDVIDPWHAIQTRSGQFIVCHGRYPDDLVHRVCMISADGRHVVHSHGGQPGSRNDQCNWPRHLALDDDSECVFVADRRNVRVKLLTPTLQYVHTVVSRDRLKGGPLRLYLDKPQRRLYVALDVFNGGEWRGYVVVFSV